MPPFTVTTLHIYNAYSKNSKVIDNLALWEMTQWIISHNALSNKTFLICHSFRVFSITVKDTLGPLGIL